MAAVISNYQKVKPSKKCLTDIPNINDNECFKWCLIRYVHPGDQNLEKIRKVGKGLARELDFKDMTFPVQKKRHLYQH